MMSSNNCTSPATGYPNIVPSQDMILGCYFLTVESLSIYYLLSNILLFSNFEKIVLDYKKGLLRIHNFIWVPLKSSSDKHFLAIAKSNKKVQNLNFILRLRIF